MSDKIPELSDAIRMGAALTKPGIQGRLCNPTPRLGGGVITETCAIGAGIYALIGNHMHQDDDLTSELEQRFPWLDGLHIKDEGGWREWYEWVWYQYDHRDMTREQIADELKQIGL